MTTTYRHIAAFNDLAALLTEQLFLPQAADYEQVRQLWNGKVKTQPAAIVRYLTVQDVIHTIRWTRSHHLQSLAGCFFDGLIEVNRDRAALN
jgi:hypothetical protein